MTNDHSLLVKTRFFHLKLVLTVARYGTIHRAADELRMTQPAATRALKELEYQLGTPLFERSRKGMRLNIYGERFAKHAQVLLNQLKAATDDINKILSGSYGHINIAMLPAAAPYLIPRTIAKLKERDLRISISVQEGTIQNLLPMLLDARVDMIVGRLPLPPQGVQLNQTALFYDSFAIVCGPHNPLVQEGSLHLSDLLEEEWIFPSPSTSLLIADVRETFNRERLVAPTPILEVNSLQTIRKVLQTTDMIGLLSFQVAREEAEHGLISILPVKFRSALTPIGITTRSVSEMPPAVHVISQVIEEVGKEMLHDSSFGLSTEQL